MKILLLLGCATWLSACGSSSGGTPDAGLQAQPPPSTVSQAPQQPTDSVPPVNSQQAPTNAQQPPLSSQPTPSVITCAQVATAVSGAGCVVSNAQMTACVEGTAANAPCSAQWQALFGCLLRGAVCNNDGSVNFGNSCPDQINALDTCMNAAANCTAASLCNGCANDCATCRCEITLVPTLDCTQACATN